MRARQTILIVCALFMASVAVVPAGAAEKGVPCTADFVVSLTPAMGADPVAGSWHSGGETGTIDCQGRKGTFGGDGRFGTKDPDTCTSGGEGWGVHSLTIQGKNTKSTFDYDFGGFSNGLVSGKFQGESLSGTFTFTPVEGDCVKTPASKGKVHIDGTLTS